jgi:pilus assembly protein FimV
MLIQVDWASGRLLREYTVLLDPPGYKESINQTPQPIVSSASARPVASSSSSNAYQSGNELVNKKPSKIKKNSAGQDRGSDSGELVTVRGDTLNSIAKELQVEGVSLDQMLVGLYENNKEAFSNGNMNRLKVGQIIKAPSKEALEEITPQQAKQAVKAHSANWNEYRNTLADAVVAAPVATESEQKQSASGKIASAEDKASPPKAGSQDVVKLSAGAKDVAAGNSGSKDVDTKILTLQEEATAREKSLKEALDRTAALEKQIEDMQKLLALKNQTMTELQNNSAKQVAAEEVKPADGSSTPSQPSQSAKPNEAKTKVATAPVDATPIEEPSFVDSLLGDSNLPLLGGAFGIGLLGAGWMFLRNKRRKDLDSFERGILTSGGLRANTVFGNTTGNASTSDTSFLTDFAQSADGSMIDTNDVDPIAEAEVYMAYGRDAQAEEILKDAIVKEPKRYELHLKLLEMYAARKDTSAFETIAGELYTTLGANDPVWGKVVALGVTVEPDNPLYNTSNLMAEKPVADQLDASDFTDVPVATEESVDFSLEDEISPDEQSLRSDVDEVSSAVMESFAAVDGSEQELTFDLGSADEELGQVDATVPKAEAMNDGIDSVSIDDNALDESNGLDFDLSLSSTEKSADSESALNAIKVSDNSMDFNLSESSAELQVTPEQSSMLPVIESDESSSLEFALPASDVTEEENAKVSDFNLEFSLPEIQMATEAEEVPEVVTQPSTLTDISFDLDAHGIMDAPLIAESSPDVTEEISFEVPSVAESEIVPEDAVVNEFDFSAINLDLGDATEAVEAVVAEDDTEILIGNEASENQDVDIKLDLVAAYIDMDDKEGARELLDEVIKEGGPQQRQRAEQLLASLT